MAAIQQHQKKIAQVCGLAQAVWGRAQISFLNSWNTKANEQNAETSARVMFLS